MLKIKEGEQLSNLEQLKKTIFPTATGVRIESLYKCTKIESSTSIVPTSMRRRGAAVAASTNLVEPKLGTKITQGMVARGELPLGMKSGH